jgi:DNA-binding transcriptional LysR family regulator
MELRQLQHFVAVAEEQHFTRAARRLNIVQSALSTSIRLLEEELGAELFLRSTRHVQLTAAGRVLLGKARGVLAAVRDARDAVAAVQGLQLGTLTIATLQSLPAFLDLPSLLSQFHARYPGIEVRLLQGGSNALIEGIRDGRIDIAFLPLCEPPRGVTTELIACEALVLACARKHPLAGKQGVPLEALKGASFVDFARDWGTRKLIDRAFAEAGVERRIAFEVSDLDTLLKLVERGLGVALVPEPLARTRGFALGVAELRKPEICWELVVAYSARLGADRTARAFLDLVEKTSRT